MTHERDELLKLVPASSEWPEGATHWAAQTVRGLDSAHFWAHEPKHSKHIKYPGWEGKLPAYKHPSFSSGPPWAHAPEIELPNHIPWDQTLVSLEELQAWEDARVPEPLGPITRPIDKKPSQAIVQPDFEVPLEDEPGHGWTDERIKTRIWGKGNCATTFVNPHRVFSYMRKVRDDVETYYQERRRDDQDTHAADLSLCEDRIAELEKKLTQAEKATEARHDAYVETKQECDRWKTLYEIEYSAGVERDAQIKELEKERDQWYSNAQDQARKYSDEYMVVVDQRIEIKKLKEELSSVKQGRLATGLNSDKIQAEYDTYRNEIIRMFGDDGDSLAKAAELLQMVHEYETLYKDDDDAPKLTLWPDRFVSLIDGNGHNILPLSDNTWEETIAWLQEQTQPEDKRVTAEQLATALERACSYGKSGIALVDGGYEKTEAVLYQYREHGLKTEE